MAKSATPAEIEVAKTLLASNDDMNVYYDAHIQTGDTTLTVRRTVQRKAYRRTDQEYLFTDDVALLNRSQVVDLIHELAQALAYMTAKEA